ncbi:MAG: enoyl-CoA hydratase/isomerase family protein [Gammaproteobacteria bacterium]
MTAHVATTREGAVTHVRLARPDKLNAFNDALVEGIADAIAAACSDGTRLLVVSGEGKGFSGGFDLGGLDSMTDGDLLLRFVRVEELLQAVYHAPFTTLSLAHGACYGAAADLFAACHFRVAAPGTRFRMPGPKFGVVLGTRRLANLIGADHARRLLFRDGPFDADEALRCGYAQELCAQVQWPEIITRTRSIAETQDANVTARILDRVSGDTRDADMAELVRSVTKGSIKARISSYLASMRAKN